MTVKEGVQKILEVARETGLYVPICWSKEDAEERLECSISSDDWQETILILDNFADFSAEVVEAIEGTLVEIDP